MRTLFPVLIYTPVRTSTAVEMTIIRNHLDVDAKAALQKAIMDFKGTVLLVCHEPEFYEGWVTQVWNVENWTNKIV